MSLDRPRLPTATASEKGEGRPVMTQKYRRKISNYLLNKDLQLRYVAVVTALSALLSGVLGYLIWRQGAKASDSILLILDSNELTRKSPELKEAIISQLQSTDTNLIVVMALFGVGLVIILSLYFIVLTHKIAGPLYKISQYFHKMADGRLGDVYALRQGDMLQDFYAKFSASHDAVRGRHVEANELFGRFLEAFDSAEVPADESLKRAVSELRAHKTLRDETLA